MTIAEFCRNLIEISSFCSRTYDFVASRKICRAFINKRIQQRLAYLQTHRNMRFMIETTGICNAKCVFCPYKDMKRPHIHMSDEIFNKIISQIKAEHIRPKAFDLFMIGEPFLDKKIFDRIHLLKKAFPDSKINITSNFSISDDSIVKQIIESDIDFINISLNAVTSKRYKQVMGLDYNRTIENINNLISQKKSKLRVSLSMVIYNNEKLTDIIKFFFKWALKADSIRFQRAVTWANKIQVSHLLGEYPQKILYPCNDLFERMPILSNGDFALCCQDAEGMTRKNIKTDSIWAAWKSEVYEKIRKIHLSASLKNFDMCKNCFGTNSNGANWFFLNR
ncbi:radical SAM/SPASM domain-containing protein [Candidatus Avelusimicrobium fimicolum]|uniref:radical SAM/SPASM domain-containing protein n=1 Tax=Candidatus Avelusimicrobium fimicolum TaxID=3416216 RepID=UPI003D0AC1BD